MKQSEYKIILFVEENNLGKLIDRYQFRDYIEIYTWNSVLTQKMPPNESDEYFFNELKLALAKLRNSFENFLLFGYLNVTHQKTRI